MKKHFQLLDAISREFFMLLGRSREVNTVLGPHVLLQITFLVCDLKLSMQNRKEHYSLYWLVDEFLAKKWSLLYLIAINEGRKSTCPIFFNYAQAIFPSQKFKE